MKPSIVVLGSLVVVLLLVAHGVTREPQAARKPAGSAVGKDGANDTNKVAAPRPNDVADFMRVKLNHSQKVLEGLALENFDMIAKHSQEMGLLAQDANWRVYQTPEYRHHSADFQRIAASLTKAAQDKNLDGAALAYVQLTLSCVNCHKYTRGIRMASR